MKPSEMTDRSSSKDVKLLACSDKCEGLRSRKPGLVGESTFKLAWLIGREKFHCLDFDKLATDTSDLFEGVLSCCDCKAGECGNDIPLLPDNLRTCEKVDPAFELV